MKPVYVVVSVIEVIKSLFPNIYVQVSEYGFTRM